MSRIRKQGPRLEVTSAKPVTVSSIPITSYARTLRRKGIKTWKLVFLVICQNLVKNANFNRTQGQPNSLKRHLILPMPLHGRPAKCLTTCKKCDLLVTFSRKETTCYKEGGSVRGREVKVGRGAGGTRTRSFGGEDDRLRESTIRLKPERGEGGTESEVRKRAALEGAILFVLMLT